MVARLNATEKVRSTLWYNEKKVAQNVAELIHSNGFLQDAGRLSIDDKLERFRRLNELNLRSKVKMLHISLGFDPSERLSNKQLSNIADRYMDGLTMNRQPYLVYRHHDSGHPHIHIVSSLIQPDGKRLRTHNMATRLSEPTRKAIEREFGLVKAQGNIRKQSRLVKVAELQRAQYANGRPTKEILHDIIQTVGKSYQYTSLDEYNAALRPYNVLADRGKPTSKTYRNGGLVYRIMDEKGNKKSAPIKASAFDFKPTLPWLEKQFALNRQQQPLQLPLLRQKVDWALAQTPATLRELAANLHKDSIDVVLRFTKEGDITGLSYVDSDLRIAADGRRLGKSFEATGLLEDILPKKDLFDHQMQLRLPISPGFKANVPQLLSTLTEGSPTHEITNEIQQEQDLKYHKHR